MKKKQWMISLIVIGLVIVSFVLCKNLWKNEQTIFEPSSTEEEEVSDEIEASESSDEEDVTTSNKNNVSDSSDKEEIKTPDEGTSIGRDDSDETTENDQQDSEDTDEDTGSVSTELPFVPFD